MCGIFALIQKSHDVFVEASVLESACEAMHHRGPDGRGTWLSKSRQAGLAHTRLAIVDLSDEAAQPMHTEDRQVAVSFNGEIYNHLALRETLSASGHAFVSDHSDTEVLLHGYRQWGIEGLLERLDGMFAFTLVDEATQTIHLCRDRLGIKPLYYYEDDHRLAVASDIPPLLQVPGVKKDINQQALAQYLCFLSVPAPDTLLESIHKLPAGHYGTLPLGAVAPLEVRRYWDSTPGSRNIPASAPADGLEQALLGQLRDSVDRRLMGDVALGLYLSGGVDSTAIAELAAAQSDSPLHSFTIGYSDHPEDNETSSAKATAERLGFTHHEILLDAAAAESCLPDLVAKQGEPLADWVCIPLYVMARETAKAGVKVVLVGEGADESFAGYPGYLAHTRFDEKYGRLIKRLPRFALTLMGRCLALLKNRHPRADEFHDILSRMGRGHNSFLSGAVGFRESDLAQLLHAASPPPDPARACDAILHHRPDGPQGVSSALLTYQEFKLRLPELLLMRIDKMTMAHGVEARVPFLDRSVIETLSRTPENRRIPDNLPKGLLKRTLSNVLPASLLNRPKKGFAAPVSQWLRNDFGGRIERTILDSRFVQDGLFQADYIRRIFSEHRIGRRDHSVRIWALYNVSLWRLWLDRES